VIDPPQRFGGVGRGMLGLEQDLVIVASFSGGDVFRVKSHGKGARSVRLRSCDSGAFSAGVPICWVASSISYRLCSW
jgi:hypothetical protein